MLKIKNLTKTYFSKKKVVTNALNDVSFETEDKGMLFLLGKSGSGKSTLLNLIGGLDTPTSGEIIVENKSLKDLNQQDLASYRNTFVSFVFQEYNLIEDFSASQNIALAIELQNMEATNEKLDEILKKVDLDIEKERNVNELSGGQKQRIAIARALIKNSKIILADEPSGALDQNTGNQIFELLKNISKEKLVIVVSHDREFAEKYADRIIELSDGKIISDTQNQKIKNETFNNIVFNSDKIIYPKDYNFSEIELEQIQNYINENADKNIKLIESEKEFLQKENNTSNNILENNDSLSKEDTFTDSIPNLDQSSKNENSNFIKSRLPFKKAIKLGLSTLKFKKFRLAVTIILCIFAFSLLAVFYSLNTYSATKAVSKAFLDYPLNNYTITHYKKVPDMFKMINAFTYTTQEQYDDFCKNVDSQALKIYEVSFTDVKDFSNLYCHIVKNSSEPLNKIYNPYSSQYTEMDENDFKNFNLNFVENSNSRMPDGNKREIIVSKYYYEYFHINGFKIGNDIVEINCYNDLIGKTIGYDDKPENNLKIVGIFDTHFDASKYDSLLDKNSNYFDDYELEDDLNYYQCNGLEATRIFGKGFFNQETTKIFGILGLMPTTKKDMMKLAKYIEPNSSYKFEMDSYNIYAEIEKANDSVKDVAFYFVIIGIVFFFFAFMLLINFVAISINNKQKEIGILRALGARMFDIYKIFVVEAFTILLITTFFCSLTNYGILKIIEVNIKSFYPKLVLFFFSIDQVLFILGISIFCAYLTTFYPVRKYMRKNPIESINKRL